MANQQVPEAARHVRESERAAANLTPQPTRPQGEGTLAPSVPPRPTFLRSFVYAWRGVIYAVRTQRNMRVHIALAIVAVALGVFLRISPVEFAMLFVAITGVFITEMINTVAEACVDLATQTYHPLARVAKDVAAGAVLVASILALVIALFVYVPHLWTLIR